MSKSRIASALAVGWENSATMVKPLKRVVFTVYFIVPAADGNVLCDRSSSGNSRAGRPALEGVENLLDKSGEMILYGTSACHLCEVAEGLIQQQQKTCTFSYVKCDISESDELFVRYGVRIPVLQRADGAELGWPFSAQDLDGFLAGSKV